MSPLDQSNSLHRMRTNLTLWDPSRLIWLAHVSGAGLYTIVILGLFASIIILLMFRSIKWNESLDDQSRGYVTRPRVADRGLIADQKRPCACPETQVDSGDRLSVSAEPGLTHGILVSCASVRPKACNQVTGRCKGGGLESPPTNKLHMSTMGGRNILPNLMGLASCNLPMGFKFYAKYSNRKESPDSAGEPGTVAPVVKMFCEPFVFLVDVVHDGIFPKVDKRSEGPPFNGCSCSL
ncbi:hypothetical protein NECAME_07425 [Necator americanus]|uniref:Uncharacterized protein n=1 Tax=Necator americanus TaxID=51031 RepID=W2TNV9_NECAM|nr:hypothetical protein NECAME_07425 [Necator americanus]ETN83364.1 hypothetical protein NECAME_07425 [Necator americanus]